MAGLDPAIHVYRQVRAGVDAPVKPGHDDRGCRAHLSPRRHCERNDLSAEALAKAEAIQSLSAEGFLDCFAALSMTWRGLGGQLSPSLQRQPTPTPSARAKLVAPRKSGARERS